MTETRSNDPLRRWVRAAGAAAALAGVAGMLLSAFQTGLRLRESADQATASAVAGYLSIVTPVDPAGRYDPVRLLSTASSLATSSYLDAGLQVAWFFSPLLSDSLGLLPLETDVTDRLAAGKSGRQPLRRRRAVVSLVPLPGRDSVAFAGWVGVWGTVPPAGGLPDPLAGAAVVVIGIAIPALVLRRRATRGDRLWLWVYVVAAAGTLAGTLASGLRLTAVQATDAPLVRAHRLVTIAATLGGVREGQLARIAPWASVRRVSAVGAGAGTVVREALGGNHSATVTARLRGGPGLEFRVDPQESRLGTVYRCLVAWFLLVGTGAAGAAFAGAHWPLAHHH